MKGYRSDRLHVCQKTDQGRKRTHNEDSVLAYGLDIPETGEANLRGRLYMVADGMGGHSAGEIASSIAVNTIGQLYYESDFVDIETTLRQVVEDANQWIYERSQSTPREQGMGTTVAAAVVRGNELYTAHVGDSRIYLIRDGRIVFVTEDHSLVKEQVRNGILTAEEAQRSPMRHVITRSLGNAPEVKVETHRLDLEDGDIVVLCSDGLWEPVGDEGIIKYVTQYIWNTPELACESLIEAANRAGGPDNISAIVIGVGRERPFGTPTQVEEGYEEKEEPVEIGEVPLPHGTGVRPRSSIFKVGVLLLALVLWSMAVALTTLALTRNKALGPTPIPIAGLTTPNPTSLPEVSLKVRGTATAEARRLSTLQVLSTRSALETGTLVAALRNTIEAQRVAVTTLQPTVPPKATIPPTPLPTKSVSPTPFALTATSVPSLPAATALPSATPIGGKAASAGITAENVNRLEQVTLPGSQNLGGAWISSVAIAPGGDAIAASGLSGMVYIWRFDGNQWERRAFTNYPGAYSVDFSKDGRLLAVGYAGGVVEISRPFNESEPSLSGAPGAVSSVAYSGKLLVAGGANGLVAWSSNTRQKGWNALEGESIVSLCFSSDESTLAAGTSDGGLWLCRPGASNGVKSRPKCTSLGQKHRGKVWGLAFTPDGKWMASGDAYGNLLVWDVSQRKVVLKEKVEGKVSGVWDSLINSLVFSNDGRLLTAATKSGVITWAFDGKSLSEVPNRLPKGPAGSVAVSSDEKMLAVGYSGQVQLWVLKQP